jgi:hypothetical protein
MCIERIWRALKISEVVFLYFVAVKRNAFNHHTFIYNQKLFFYTHYLQVSFGSQKWTFFASQYSRIAPSSNFLKTKDVFFQFSVKKWVQQAKARMIGLKISK